MAKAGFIEREQTHLAVWNPDKTQSQILALSPEVSAAILGAPGTGKTRLLIELVAARVAAGVNPDNIVVLTPNRVAAGRLRNALALRLGIPTNGALARTPGSLAFALAQEQAYQQGR